VNGAVIFIIALLGVIFAADAAARWWRQNRWRYRDRDDDDDDESGVSG
jgi:hypothetical protein